jgi:hypothetical protein
MVFQALVAVGLVCAVTVQEHIKSSRSGRMRNFTNRLFRLPMQRVYGR